MAKFEYTIYSFERFDDLDFVDVIKYLNELGSDGWQLCSTYRNAMIFKREINNEA